MSTYRGLSISAVLLWLLCVRIATIRASRRVGRELVMSCQITNCIPSLQDLVLANHLPVGSKPLRPLLAWEVAPLLALAPAWEVAG